MLWPLFPVIMPTSDEPKPPRPVAHDTEFCKDFRLGRMDFIASTPGQITCALCRQASRTGG